MKTPVWQRAAARIVLATFTTAVVACGGSQGEAPSTTTVTVVVPTTTSTAPPATLPAPPPTLPAQAPDRLSKQELRDLVAPVALYPDVVLASLLPATTNPDQVHDAAQWIGQAQRVDRVPEDRGWDGSVVGLLQFPDVVRWLDQNPAWTDQMGQAVTYQQGDVLDAIQDYRRAVRDAGNLKSNQYQTVRGTGDQDIRIEPARQDVVYVPSYDTAAATQPQPAQSSGINPWLAFGGGAVVGALGAWALYSIFDDDHDHGGGGRTINTYNNYYYSGGRRPQAATWQARPRQYRNRPAGWQQPRRLTHTAQQGQAGKTAALRPPMTATTAGAPGPRELRREQRQEQKQEHRTQKQERQQQKQERQQEERQHKRDRREQRQEQQQEHKQQRQQQKQERRQGEQQRRQEREQQQREQRKAQQAQREERQQQRKEQRQQNQQNQQNKQNKKKQRQAN